MSDARAQPSTLGHALLQVLSRETASGYDLKKFFQESIGRTWHAYDTQIYRELKQLEQHGYISGEDAAGLGPRRRLYTITDAGRESLVEWLLSPIDLSKTKDEFGLRIWTAELLAREDIVALFISARKHWSEQLDHMQLAMHRVLTSEMSSAADRHGSLGRRLTISYAIAQTEAKIAWSTKAIKSVTDEAQLHTLEG